MSLRAERSNLVVSSVAHENEGIAVSSALRTLEICGLKGSGSAQPHPHATRSGARAREGKHERSRQIDIFNRAAMQKNSHYQRGAGSLLQAVLLRFFQLVLALAVLNGSGLRAEEFRVPPYLQDPSLRSIVIRWLTDTDQPGTLTCRAVGREKVVFEADSRPHAAEALKWSRWEAERYRDGKPPSTPWFHEVLVTGLRPGRRYHYRVQQGGAIFEGSFATPPQARKKVRFIVYADSETEPESAGKYARWPERGEADAQRRYLVDQTEGYANNLRVIRRRRPAFVVIAGDLVQCGGEQRDWDEFWRHNTSPDGHRSLAGNVTLVTALGNHEYYAGPELGGYRQPHSERAVARYLAYFGRAGAEKSESGASGRFHRFDYGPVSLLVLDTNNGLPHRSENDTNFYLKGRGKGRGAAPDFNPGSRQYRWLERELARAQLRAEFTFVAMHQAPYSSGPHGKRAGSGPEGDPLSGQPVRVLTPLFLRLGVDAVFSGHDEMYERSTIGGKERLPNGGQRPHRIHFYDVGIGGDGLRGPDPVAQNPCRRFLAHSDSPEIREDGRHVSGGKHYGHLEVDIEPVEGGGWKATLTSVYVLPRPKGKGPSFQRMVYDDRIVLHSPARGNNAEEE